MILICNNEIHADEAVAWFVKNYVLMHTNRNLDGDYADIVVGDFIVKLAPLYREDEKTWEEICDDVATGKTNYIDFRGVVFNRVKHGHWEQIWEDANQIQARCSCCGMVFWIGKGRDGNYCPNCGAKMDEVEDE